MERELLRKLKDPSVRYLDYYTTSFDHVAHLSQDLRRARSSGPMVP
jgi:hypothetical protein